MDGLILRISTVSGTCVVQRSIVSYLSLSQPRGAAFFSSLA